MRLPIAAVKDGVMDDYKMPGSPKRPCVGQKLLCLISLASLTIDTSFLRASKLSKDKPGVQSPVSKGLLV